MAKDVNINKWLNDNGFDDLIPQFRKHEISLDVLPALKNDDLREMGIPIGRRKTLLRLIQEIESGNGANDAAGDRAEHRFMSILMWDIVNSSDLFATLDAEEYRELINQFRDVCERAIDTCDGEIDQFEGDGLLAYFGYPRAHDDNANRAILAAKLIAKELENRQFVRQTKVQCRFGVATGWVVIDPTTGSTAAQHGGVHGRIPTLSRRIQSIASSGRICICENTKEALKYDEALVELGKYQLKGFSDEYFIWEVSDNEPTDSYKPRVMDRMFFGRTKEIKLIEDIWNGLNETGSRVISISGEPGIGKSSLVNRIFSSLDLRNEQIALLYCSPFHQSSSFYPVLDYIRWRIAENFGLDSISELEQGFVERYLRLIGVSLTSKKEIVSLLCSQVFDDASTSKLSTANKQDSLAKDLANIIQAIVQSKQNIITLEDGHCADPGTLEVMRRISDTAASQQYLVLITSRNDTTTNSDTFIDLYIGLDPLPRRSAMQILDAVSGEGDTARIHSEEIVEKAGGIPYFIIELVRYINDNKKHDPSSANDLKIPHHIQNILLSKFDEACEKNGNCRIVGYAATILGEVFTKETLSWVLPEYGSRLDLALDRLIENDVLKIKKNNVYTFCHALQKDVIYESMLNSSRKSLHERIAETLVEKVSTTSAGDYSTIAQHFIRAERAGLPIDWWCKASDRALSLGIPQEAISHLRNAIQSIDERKTGLHSKMKLPLLLKLGDCYRSAEGTASKEAASCFKSALEGASKDGELGELCHSLYGSFATSFSNSQLSLASLYAKRLIQIGNETGLSEAKVSGSQAIGIVYFARGRIDQASRILRACYLHTTREPSWHKYSFAQYPFVAASYLSWSLYLQNRLFESRKVLKETIDKLGQASPYQKAILVGNICYLLQWTGELNKLSGMAVALDELCEANQIGAYSTVAKFFQNYCESKRNEDAHVINTMRVLIDRMEPYEKQYYLTLIAECYLYNGKYSEARKLSEEAINITKNTGEDWYKAETLKILGLAKIAESSDPHAGRECLNDAYHTSVVQGAKAWSSRVDKARRIIDDEGQSVLNDSIFRILKCANDSVIESEGDLNRIRSKIEPIAIGGRNS